MAFAQQANYSVDSYKERYQDITALYDYADELVATVESGEVKDQKLQMELVESLVNEVADATDILAEEFILVAESAKPRATPKFSKKRIEGALRRVFVAIHSYYETMGGINNIANKIVEKMQSQLDKIMVIFLELVNISIQSIMGRAEMEAMRMRNTRISIMMHQLSMSQIN